MLKIYDTFSRKKTLFEPIDPQNVRLYVCGPTVYDRAHIGNARPVVIFDVLSRLLRHLYPKVTYVRNITDIDDKIIKRAHIRKISIEALTEETIQFYNNDMSALKAIAPDFSPRATEHVSHMIEMVKILIDKGHAYLSKGHVLFQIDTYKNYGELSCRTLDEMIAGARVEVAPYKKHPGDFILWKPSTDTQPGWESPWGRGRPGWHLECSAMTKALFGNSFDIHGGGCELAFPHHENERAQSMCANTSGIFAKYWMHNGLLTIQGEKMSKSLGNVLTVDTLLENYPGESIRVALLSGHYRQPLDWSDNLLEQSHKSLNTFYGALKCTPDKTFWDSYETSWQDYIPKEVKDALNDDLNTPLALAHLHKQAKDIHKATNSIEKLNKIRSLRAGGNLLGLLDDNPDDWFKKPKEIDVVMQDHIECLIEKRKKARLEKNFQEADSIRKELEKMHITLEDTSKGTTWRYSHLTDSKKSS